MTQLISSFSEYAKSLSATAALGAGLGSITQMTLIGLEKVLGLKNPFRITVAHASIYGAFFIPAFFSTLIAVENYFQKALEQDFFKHLLAALSMVSAATCFSWGMTAQIVHLNDSFTLIDALMLSAVTLVYITCLNKALKNPPRNQ